MDFRTQQLQANEARNLCKTAMVAIRNFVLYGHPIDEFEMSLLRRDESAATKVAHHTLLIEGVVEQLVDFVNQHIPAGMFGSDSEITTWYKHQGLTGADEQQRMWFWMMSSWWKPAHLKVSRPTQAVA